MTPARPAIRLEPADEYLHENTGEPNFNESMYFNFFDTRERLGGFLRIGNRPNERMAETTICLYQPDGPVVFNFKRPAIEDNSRFQAGGMRFEVDQPFERLRIEYQGSACRLAEPLSMRDPRTAFQSNPFVPVEVSLAIRGVGPMFGGVREQAEPVDPEKEFARGHYEQHHRASGRIAIDGVASEFDGLGLRDHSWGPRSWQAPLYYRWLTGNFGEDFGFMANWIAGRDGSEIRAGFLHRGRELVRVRHVEIDTEFAGAEKLHDRLLARLTCEGGEKLEIEGRVLSMIPLRNRRAGHTTRIAEGMTEWRCQGRVGYGLSEYLDQVE
jgi:hypothetical protein